MSNNYQVGDKVSVVGEVQEIFGMWMDVSFCGDAIGRLTLRTDEDIKVVERKKTPGQKAFEAYYKSFESNVTWDEVLKTTRESWEAAAAAVTEES